MSVFPHRQHRALEIEYRNVCIAYRKAQAWRPKPPSVRDPSPGAQRARRAGPAGRAAHSSVRRTGLHARGPWPCARRIGRDRCRDGPRPHGPRCAQPSGSCETRRARSEKRDVTFRYDSPQSTARGDATSDRRPGRRSRTRRLAREPERVSDRRRRLRLHISTRDVHSRLLDVSVGPGAESPYSRVTSSLGQSSRLTRSSRSPRTRRTPRRQGHLP